jgi:hypothetical protein
LGRIASKSAYVHPTLDRNNGIDRCIPQQSIPEIPMNTTPSFLNTSPASTIGELITAFQVQEDLTDDQIAAKLGYQQGNVVMLLKRGVMTLAWDKIMLLAEITEMAPERIFEMVAQERDPALLDLIRAMKLVGDVTPQERRLIDHCRTLDGGREVTPFVIDGRPVIALLVR